MHVAVQTSGVGSWGSESLPAAWVITFLLETVGMSVWPLVTDVAQSWALAGTGTASLMSSFPPPSFPTACPLLYTLRVSKSPPRPGHALHWGEGV